MSALRSEDVGRLGGVGDGAVWSRRGNGAASQEIEEIDLAGLAPIGKRLRLGDYIWSVWRRRHFIMADSKARVSTSASGTALGRAWLVLSPLLSGLVYYFVFGVVMDTKKGIDNFIAYLLVGVFMFHFTTKTLTAGMNSVTSGKNLSSTFDFPKATLPVAVVVRELIRNIPVFIVMLAMVAAIPPHAVVTWRWSLFPAIVALQVVFVTGLTLVFARVVTLFPDVGQLMSFVLRGWFYISGVFFTISRYDGHPLAHIVMQSNPMYQFLSYYRDILVYGTTPSTGVFVSLIGWSLGFLVFGTVFFWLAEERYCSGQ